MRFAFLGIICSGFLAAQNPEINLTLVDSNIPNVTDIQNAADGSGRLFLVEQQGTILILRTGAVASQPFLDISTRTAMNGECGLLGLAFPPGFAAKRYFYVNYTDPECANTVISRFSLTADDNVADPFSEQVILTQPQPYINHKGGQLRFGPDGFLYAGFGDGGSAGDPRNNGQNPGTWLGKLLRIDTESNRAAYQIPPSNPFVANPRWLPEIWANGLRNPWRFSFDRLSGDLWIADVGQDLWEEIDFQPAASAGGQNYGWHVMEGTHCFDPSDNCDPTGLTLPVFDYLHENGDDCIIGGFVYRGKSWPRLVGTYIYGDNGSGRIWGLTRDGDSFRNRILIESGISPSTFGEDEDGEVYVADYPGNAIYRIDAAAGETINRAPRVSR